MTKFRIKAILWRRMNKATYDTLAGGSQGQYDIRLGADEDVGDFFQGVERQETTTLGGFTLNVQLHPLEGPENVPGEIIQIRYMGANSQRRDWYIASQRPETAYRLWRQGRGAPSSYSGAGSQFVLLIKDVNDRYHARWVTDQSLGDLPDEIRQEMLSKDIGVLNFSVE